MKTLKLLFSSIFTIVFLSSCAYQTIDTRTNYTGNITINELISSYDLWYVDIHNTRGNAEVPFLERAFTVTFDNGILYANNNIAGIGNRGDGYGIEIGTYDAFRETIETSHNQGYSDFRVIQVSNNEIRLEDLNQNVSYSLIGYQISTFDYNQLFYDNIEYFLQEYIAWEQVNITAGNENQFDDEHYLKFTLENTNTFRSSGDVFGIDIARIKWDYVGDYKIVDYKDVNNVKLLTLFYDNNDVEEFNLTIINDRKIRLKHLNTGTLYDFVGKGFIRYLRSSETKNNTKSNRNSNRKRKRIKREKQKFVK